MFSQAVEAFEAITYIPVQSHSRNIIVSSPTVKSDGF